MPMFWVGLAVGLFTGGSLGVLAMGAVALATAEDRRRAADPDA
jgi:hypothetical protein